MMIKDMTQRNLIVFATLTFLFLDSCESPNAKQERVRNNEKQVESPGLQLLGK
jgi:hypothetical protein